MFIICCKLITICIVQAIFNKNSVIVYILILYTYLYLEIDQNENVVFDNNLHVINKKIY